MAGAVYRFRLHLAVINTVTASNLVISLAVGATNVATLTQALGTTARVTPGGIVVVEGDLTFYSPTTAEAVVRAFTSTPVAFDAAAGTTATVTVPAQPPTSRSTSTRRPPHPPSSSDSRRSGS